jgi:hypothetical protein
MNIAQLMELLDAKGTDLSAWRQQERASAEQLMASEPQARAAYDQARRLDDVLARELTGAPSAAKDDALAAHILAALGSEPLPPQRRSILSGWWPTTLLDVDLTPAWPRVAALACAVTLGIALGLFGPDVSMFQTRGSAAAETDLATLVSDLGE